MKLINQSIDSYSLGGSWLDDKRRGYDRMYLSDPRGKNYEIGFCFIINI